MSSLTNPIKWWISGLLKSTGRKGPAFVGLVVVLVWTLVVWGSWMLAFPWLGMTDSEAYTNAWLYCVAVFALVSITFPIAFPMAPMAQESHVQDEVPNDGRDMGAWIKSHHTVGNPLMFVVPFFSKRYGWHLAKSKGKIISCAVLVLGFVYWFLTQFVALDVTAVAIMFGAAFVFASLLMEVHRDKSHWEADDPRYDKLGESRFDAAVRFSYDQILEEEAAKKAKNNPVTTPAPHYVASDSDVATAVIASEDALADGFFKRAGMDGLQRAIDFLGGEKRVSYMVLLLALFLFGLLILKSAFGFLAPLLPLLGLMYWAYRGRKTRGKTRNGLAYGGALVAGIALAILMTGVGAAFSQVNTSTLLNAFAPGVLDKLNVLNYIHLPNQENAEGLEPTPFPQATVPMDPSELIVELPPQALRDFNKEFKQGAGSELAQVVAWINQSVDIVSIAEADRDKRQAEYEAAGSNDVALYDPGVLVDGFVDPETGAKETGVGESNSVVQAWCYTGSLTTEGFIAETYAERISKAPEGIDAATLAGYSNSAVSLCKAYDAFLRMLKALRLDEDNEVMDPTGAQAALEEFLKYREEANGYLASVVIDGIKVFDPAYVELFVEKATPKEAQIQQTATPGANQQNTTVTDLVATEVPSQETTPEPTGTLDAAAIIAQLTPTATSMAHGFNNCTNPLGVQGRYLGRHLTSSHVPGQVVVATDSMTGQEFSTVAVDGPAANLNEHVVVLNGSVGKYLGFDVGCNAHVFQYQINLQVRTWGVVKSIPQGINPGDFVIADSSMQNIYVTDVTGAVRYRQVSPVYQELGVSAVAEDPECNPVDMMAGYEGYHLTGIYGGMSKWHQCSNGRIRVDYVNDASTYLNGSVFSIESPPGIAADQWYTCEIPSGTVQRNCQHVNVAVPTPMPPTPVPAPAYTGDPNCDPALPGYTSAMNAYGMTAMYGGSAVWYACTDGKIKVTYANGTWVHAISAPPGVPAGVSYSCVFAGDTVECK